MPDVIVLVGFAESTMAPEVVWSLVGAGFRVVAFARAGRASALRYSRHVSCYDICAPEMDLERAVADMRSVMESVTTGYASTQRVLLPMDDMAIWLCDKVTTGTDWFLAGPQGATATITLDKELQCQAASKAGFHVPNTALARTVKDVYDFVSADGFPVILKPAECVPIVEGQVFKCKKWVSADRSELDQAMAAWGERVPLLVQHLVSGNGEGVFGLAARGGIRAWSAHRRLRMRNPAGSGASACVSQPVPEDLKSKVEAFIQDAGWYGLFMIEVLRDKSGGLWFMELNGRPWGSLALARRQGLEYPAWHVQLLLDERSSAGLGSSSRPGLVCRDLARDLMHLLFVLRGARSKAQRRNWPSFWKSLKDVVHFDRADTIYNWCPEDRKVFVADFYYSIKDTLFKAKN